MSLERLWASLGAGWHLFWSIRDHFVIPDGLFFVVFALFGPLWGLFGRLWGVFGASLAVFGVSLGPLWPSLGAQMASFFSFFLDFLWSFYGGAFFWSIRDCIRDCFLYLLKPKLCFPSGKRRSIRDCFVIPDGHLPYLAGAVRDCNVIPDGSKLCLP